jgi:hypothetical protein
MNKTEDKKPLILRDKPSEEMGEIEVWMDKEEKQEREREKGDWQFQGYSEGMWRRCGEALTRCGLPQRSTATLPSADQSSSSLKPARPDSRIALTTNPSVLPQFDFGSGLTLNYDPSPSRLFHRVTTLPLRQHEPHARSRVHVAGLAPDLCRSSSIPQNNLCAATIYSQWTSATLFP